MLVVTEAMNSESANKFISALVKALQTLCHGYVEFNDGIEIIGHIYLNIDSGSSFDYVVKEKLCKNAENSTMFVSKSFQAVPPSDECLPRKDRDDEHSAFEDASMSPTSGTLRLQSAITSISNVLSGAHENIKPRIMEHSSHHSSLQNTGKRKKEHNGNYNSMQPPLKYTTLQTSSSSSSSSVYFGSGQSSKHATDRNHAEHFSNASHAEFFGADSNQGPDDEDDLHLDVTFVKEEYESQRSRGVSVSAASRLSQDLSSNSSSMLHDGSSGSGALGYSSSHHPLPQQFASGTAGNMGSLNPAFQDTSQVDMDQHGGPRPPNPRNKTAEDDRPTFQVPAVPVKYFRCPVCNIIIRHKNNIKRHMRRHNGDVFTCPFCDSTQTCRWQLERHLEAKHFIKSENSLSGEDVPFIGENL
ncbi:unnamed protein product [Candidula unifasciata]|uniref:C2H2-type domain-containing protein n=1 Tax=Candidula unifasciata TaxID=100452 RepID=A0A8S3ZYY3_9EUPU|nr:unnamed protein product [Candidula unifasciata]